MPHLFVVTDSKERTYYAIADGLPDRDMELHADELDRDTSPADDPNAYLSAPLLIADSAREALDRFVDRGLDAETTTCEPALAQELVDTPVTPDDGMPEAAASWAVYRDALGDPRVEVADNYFAWNFYRQWFSLGHAEGPLPHSSATTRP